MRELRLGEVKPLVRGHTARVGQSGVGSQDCGCQVRPWIAMPEGPSPPSSWPLPEARRPQRRGLSLLPEGLRIVRSFIEHLPSLGPVLGLGQGSEQSPVHARLVLAVQWARVVGAVGGGHTPRWGLGDGRGREAPLDPARRTPKCQGARGHVAEATREAPWRKRPCAGSRGRGRSGRRRRVRTPRLGDRPLGRGRPRRARLEGAPAFTLPFRVLHARPQAPDGGGARAPRILPGLWLQQCRWVWATAPPPGPRGLSRWARRQERPREGGGPLRRRAAPQARGSGLGGMLPIGMGGR